VDSFEALELFAALEFSVVVSGHRDIRQTLLHLSRAVPFTPEFNGPSSQLSFRCGWSDGGLTKLSSLAIAPTKAHQQTKRPVQ